MNASSSAIARAERRQRRTQAAAVSNGSAGRADWAFPNSPKQAPISSGSRRRPPYLTRGSSAPTVLWGVSVIPTHGRGRGSCSVPHTGSSRRRPRVVPRRRVPASVSTRPPTRGRASRIVTACPAAWSRCAATRPESPAPTTSIFMKPLEAAPSLWESAEPPAHEVTFYPDEIGYDYKSSSGGCRCFR